MISERNLGVKFTTTWKDEAAEVGRAREEERKKTKIRKEKKSAKRSSRPARRQKSREHCRCPSRLAKVPGAEPPDQMKDQKNCRPFRRETHFNFKTCKKHQCRSTFGRWDVEKCAHRCGANHISKSNCAKHHSFGPLLRIDMFKKCTPLRPKHISKWKCAKHTIFGWFLRLAILHTKHISM